MMFKRSLKSVTLCCALLVVLLSSAGCTTDFRKGTGPALIYKSELRLLDGPVSNQITMGKDSPNLLVGHDPGSPFTQGSFGMPVQPEHSPVTAGNSQSNGRPVRD